MLLFAKKQWWMHVFIYPLIYLKNMAIFLLIKSVRAFVGTHWYRLFYQDTISISSDKSLEHFFDKVELCCADFGALNKLEKCQCFLEREILLVVLLVTSIANQLIRKRWLYMTDSNEYRWYIHKQKDRHHLRKARTKRWLMKCMGEGDTMVGVGISHRS